MHARAVYRITDETGDILHADRVASRGRLMFLVKDTCCYRVDLSELVG
jgi:hypothetical protein